MERECIGRDGWHQWLAKWRPYEHWVCVFCILSIWNFFVSASYVSCIFITSWILGFSWLIHSSLSTFDKLILLTTYVYLAHLISFIHPIWFFFLLQHSFVFSAKQQMHITSHSQNVQFFHSNISCRCVIIVHHYYSKQYGNSIFWTIHPYQHESIQSSLFRSSRAVTRYWLLKTMKLHEALYIQTSHISSALLSLQCQGSPFGVAFLFVDLSSVLP